MNKKLPRYDIEIFPCYDGRHYWAASIIENPETPGTVRTDVSSRTFHGLTRFLRKTLDARFLSRVTCGKKKR